MTPLRVAVVGSGPAGLYALEHLLDARGLAVEVDVFERLPTPWGLIRAGVAPDHPEKKLVADRHFAVYLDDPRVCFFGNVSIGRDISVEELQSWYDAVVLATGAGGDVPLNVPGEELPGCWSARQLVGFYNGQPDFSHLELDLSTERAVVVGNGNVALDVARILTAPVWQLESTDIADHALQVLKKSAVREVVVLGRRSAAESAFHSPELEELEHLNGVDVVVEGDSLPTGLEDVWGAATWDVRRKLGTLRRLTQRPHTPGHKRIVLRFLTSPTALVGQGRVQAVQLRRNRLESGPDGVLRAQPDGEVPPLPTGLVVRAVGYRGTPFPGLPFDDVRGVVPNLAGRVIAGAATMPGIYVTGWIKRGCRGVIGSNKKCARQTVAGLLGDLAAGHLRGAAIGRADVADRIRERQPDLVSREGWHAIDRIEKICGRVQDRPRIKITDVDTLIKHASQV